MNMIHSVDFGTCILDMHAARCTQDVKKAYLYLLDVYTFIGCVNFIT